VAAKLSSSSVRAPAQPVSAAAQLLQNRLAKPGFATGGEKHVKACGHPTRPCVGCVRWPGPLFDEAAQ